MTCSLTAYLGVEMGRLPERTSAAAYGSRGGAQDVQSNPCTIHGVIAIYFAAWIPRICMVSTKRYNDILLITIFD
jgi:hypothetical protein